MQTMIRRTIAAVAAATLLFLFAVMIADNRRFIVRRYTVRTDKLRCAYRFVYLSDLHQKVYPGGNEAITAAVRKEKPDFIIAGGDFITSRTAAEQAYRNEFSFEDAALSLLQSLRGVAPVYFVNGNHEEKLETSEDEVLRGAYARFMTDLSSAGVRVLHNEKILLGDGLLLYGYEHGMEHYEKIFSNPLTLPEMQEEIGFSNPDLFCLLAVHNPKFFPVYARWGADLTVSGHVHGGLMRIGKRGVIGPDLHLFPEYSGGLYHKDGRTMILSCGIGAHTLPVRIFNPGEVTVVDIVPLNQ